MTAYKKVKDLGLLHKMYYNYYGVRISLLEDGNMLMQAVKGGRLIKNHKAIVSVEMFRNQFEDDERSEVGNILHALGYLDPDLVYDQFNDTYKHWNDLS